MRRNPERVDRIVSEEARKVCVSYFDAVMLGSFPSKKDIFPMKLIHGSSINILEVAADTIERGQNAS